MDGPAWVGIGAQRCGTTWFTQMLIQHPDICLRDGSDSFLLNKEMHYFDTSLIAGRPDIDAYRRAFVGCRAVGEFTPAYLRLPWVASLLKESCSPSTPLVVLVRDPIERFWSALRWYTRPDGRAELFGDHEVIRLLGSELVWGGMYADQLAVWERVFDGDRLIVIQYEAAVADPATACRTVFDALGLPAITPQELGASPTTTVAGDGDDRPAWVEDALRIGYDTMVDRMTERWGIDRALWPNFG